MWKGLASLIGYNPEAAEMFAFHKLLGKTQRFQASLPRDKIFALGSLCQLCPSQSFKIAPNYSISEAKVWTVYTREAIVSSKGFDILFFAKGTSESRSAIPELPSWSVSPDFGVPTIQNDIQGTFDAAHGMSLKLIHDMSDYKRLKVKGIMFAPIKVVPVSLSNRPFPVSLLLHHLEVLYVLKRLSPKYKHVSGQSRGESVWRTLCANGTGTNRTATAPLSYGKCFKNLMINDIVHEALQIAEGDRQKNVTPSHSLKGFGSTSPTTSSPSNHPPHIHDTTVKDAHQMVTPDGTLPHGVFARLQAVFEALDELADGECIPTKEDVARAYTNKTVKHAAGSMLPASLGKRTSEKSQEARDARTYGDRLIDEFATRDGLDDTAALRLMRNIERQEERFLEVKELEKDESFGFIRASAVL